MTRHRSSAIPDSITKITGGYPSKLVIFQVEASPYYWVRYFTKGKIYRKSTKTTNKNEAIAFAKVFYEDILLKERNSIPLGSSPSFERCAKELLIKQEELILRGERNPLLNQKDTRILKLDLLPYFRGYDIKEIKYKNLEDYISGIAKRNLASATIKKHINLLGKIFNLALREELIEYIPPMPKIKVIDSPRGWFNDDEYDHLKKTVFKLIENKVVVRYHLIDDEIRLLITFMVNAFLRPSDIKNLRNRNIQIVDDEDTFLRIQTDSSKTINHPIVSMPAGVGIYRDIIKYQQNMNRPCRRDDFVFFPHLQNRDYALRTICRQFNEILSKSELKNSSSGQTRTIYSLRHTAIMLRLTKGDNIDLLTLARNSRTSVSMIERFYARPLNAEMNLDKLQSFRPKSNKNNVRKTTETPF